ncbi:MAG: hypothetical protein BECKG1743D_GA0114223_103531 [Candidatus Kentron sp. G]|nr:MAG: hypothetical protein BECKG1743D_GA0114223_103531 [Candidatus Kentron sp. G]VFN05308.1 MAG: hypothetical protein BECKG1743E_GA0114224_108481 [Candidatus Kentron sp. G]
MNKSPTCTGDLPAQYWKELDNLFEVLKRKSRL